MAHFILQFLGKIGDNQGIMRALVYADSATDTEWFANQWFAG